MVFQKYSSNPLTNSNSCGQGVGGGVGGVGGGSREITALTFLFLNYILDDD